MSLPWMAWFELWVAELLTSAYALAPWPPQGGCFSPEQVFFLHNVQPHKIK